MEIKKKQHTEIPWKVGTTLDTAWGHGLITVNRTTYDKHTGGFPFICYVNDEPEMEANAQFIVKACNNYEKMIEVIATQGTEISKISNSHQALLDALNHIIELTNNYEFSAKVDKEFRNAVTRLVLTAVAQAEKEGE